MATPNPPKYELEYELQNFKAFASSGPMHLRPITLIYGPNSSGKSSILQSLLLLKQTIDEAENPDTLLLPKGILVDLGGYREFIYRHETERPFSFRLSQPVERGARSNASPVSELPPAVDVAQVGLQVTFGYDEKNANVIITRYDFFVNGDAMAFASFELSKLAEEETQRARGQYGLRLSRGANVYRGTNINLEHPVWRMLWEAEREQLASNIPFNLQERINALQAELSRLESLENPVQLADSPTPKRRRKPRSQAEKSVLMEELGNLREIQEVQGRNWEQVCADLKNRHKRTLLVVRNFLPLDATLIPAENEVKDSRYLFHFAYRRGYPALSLYMATSELLRRFLDEMVYVGPLREFPERHYVYSGNVAGQVGKTGRLVPDILFKNRRLLKQVNDQLEEFNIGYELVITGAPSGELNDVFSLRLIDRRTKVSASILDVGFGISQVLPVIVQSMLSSGKTLCIEQPEIHLHPRLQADLGSLVAMCTAAPYNNRFIIETHSQHLLLRIQRLIRERKLDHKHVSVIYVDKSDSSSRSLELRLDSDGNFIDEWPGGFYEEGYAEIFSS